MSVRYNLFPDSKFCDFDLITLIGNKINRVKVMVASSGVVVKKSAGLCFKQRVYPRM